MSAEAGDCRWCGRVCSLLDAEGEWAHPCCAFWIVECEEADCLACQASAAAEQRWQTSGKAWAKKVAAHWAEEAKPPPGG